MIAIPKIDDRQKGMAIILMAVFNFMYPIIGTLAGMGIAILLMQEYKKAHPEAKIEPVAEKKAAQ